ncbi:DNA-binding protein [Gemmobacter aquarius]|uniref:DNA-binding protein n=1 Tax=Paragemmobacter aquarius TaxID=2169400 RepID=A0A2S0UM38_9RHOB|nr:helix-turn-helix domain-containing protein [Gemmobacter aquarius]AWB48861.1 DNA-binding protein [Gemmobacter aquarius]
MANGTHSTDGLPASARADHWNSVIAQAYFPLDLTFRDAARFEGRLESGTLGDLSLSRLQTESVQYERHRRHISRTTEEQYLITIPRQSPVEFSQSGREVRCDPGGFILERGDEPYRFSYGAANDLCVIKLAKPILAERLRNPDRFCALVFNGREGIGSVFTTMAQQIQHQTVAGTAVDPVAGSVIGRQLVELLALTLDRSSDVETGAASSVREGHRRRAQSVILSNLSNPGLSPEIVADRIGISKRYLHELFAEVNLTVSQFIREQRLHAARDLLHMANPGPLSDIAYRFGFSDQAQFSRLFKAMFGQTPSSYRASRTI